MLPIMNIVGVTLTVTRFVGVSSKLTFMRTTLEAAPTMMHRIIERFE